MKIIPRSKRAKDRVKQHGEDMELVKHGRFDNLPAVLVKSQEKTWSGGQHWFGWFTDAEIVI